jgi:hypothetical protein
MQLQMTSCSKQAGCRLVGASNGYRVLTNQLHNLERGHLLPQRRPQFPANDRLGADEVNAGSVLSHYKGNHSALS